MREFKNSLEKKIGTFNVKIDNLQEAPEDFRCRAIDQDWVAEIKSSIRQAPGELVTKVPVMIPLNVATDPYQFQESMLDGVLYLIGGNHVVKACKELLEEEKENEEFRSYSNISADVFLGLSPEQAKMIGNHHNRKTTTKKVLFQDQVLQAREIYLKHREEGEDAWKETATIILGNLHERTYTKKSLSLVLSVASHEEDVFFQIERLFELWNSRNSMKDFPQQIFKNIPCVEGPKICQYLRRVEQLKDIKTVAEEISKDRKKRILEQVFTSRTGCQTWEEASERYALHAEKMEEFLDSIKVSQRLIPTDFINFCDEAVRQEVPVDLNTVVTVNVSVELNEKQREYLDQEKRKFEMKICKGLKKLKTAAEE
ncbi:uncharacterized protein [Magallana gigas]|uniref:uncharacterized protein n=1 Tax=Magallana gigas TaxID=29159 RepID=UPI0033423369